MSIKEVQETINYFEDYIGSNKMKIFHQKESGVAIIIIYNPNILGITKIKDLLTLNSDELRNLDLFYKTRDVNAFTKMLAMFRKLKQN
jgi:hypothetical protein